MTIPVYAKGLHISDNGELVIDADALAEAGVRSVEIIEGQPPAETRAGAGRPTYGELEALLAEKGARIATLKAQLEAESNTSRHWLSTAEKIAGARDDAYEDCCALKMQIKELEAERSAANMAAEKASETSRVALAEAEKAFARIVTLEQRLAETKAELRDWIENRGPKLAAEAGNARAERAEAEAARLREKHKKATKLISRYRPALEAYADKENWFECDSARGIKTEFLLFKDGRDFNGYEIAQDALEAPESGEPSGKESERK